MNRFIVGSTHKDVMSSLWEMQDNQRMVFVKQLNDNFQNASWIAAAKSGGVLYCTNETQGTISSKELMITESETDIKQKNVISCQGEGSTHVVESNDGHFLVVSNFHSGSITIIPANDTFESSSYVIVHENGTARRAHAHQCVMHPNKRIFYVCDLGLDAIFMYKYLPASSIVTQVSVWKAPIGSGPRHMVLDASAECAFVVFELTNQVCMLHTDPTSGCLQDGSVSDGDSDRASPFYSTLPAGVSPVDMGAAEILLSVDGRYIYISNRDVAPSAAPSSEEGKCGVHDSEDRSSITVFAVLPNKEGLRWVQTVSSRGRHPRHMCFTRQGACLLVANRDANNLVSFAVDRDTGKIQEDSAAVTHCGSDCRDPGFIMELPKKS